MECRFPRKAVPPELGPLAPRLRDEEHCRCLVLGFAQGGSAPRVQWHFRFAWSSTLRGDTAWEGEGVNLGGDGWNTSGSNGTSASAGISDVAPVAEPSQ